MGILDEFELPDVAREFITKQQAAGRLQMRNMGNGVTDFHGQNAGLAFRFFVADVEKKAQSEDWDMEINKPVEMIQIHVDKNHKPAHRVVDLPEELLKFRRKKVYENQGIKHFQHVRIHPETGKEMLYEDPEYDLGLLVCTGGLYSDDFKRWQEGRGARGLPLDRWDKITSAQAKTFASQGIHTVQQLADMNSDVIEDRFPTDLRKAFNEAIHWVRGQEAGDAVIPFANEIEMLKVEMKKKDEQIARLIASVEGSQKAPRKRTTVKRKQAKPRTEEAASA